MIDKSIKHINKSISKNFNDKDFLELFNKGGLAFLFRIGGQIMGFLLTFVIAYFFGANGNYFFIFPFPAFLFKNFCQSCFPFQSGLFRFCLL